MITGDVGRVVTGGLRDGGDGAAVVPARLVGDIVKALPAGAADRVQTPVCPTMVQDMNCGQTPPASQPIWVQ